MAMTHPDSLDWSFGGVVRLCRRCHRTANCLFLYDADPERETTNREWMCRACYAEYFEESQRPARPEWHPADVYGLEV